MNYQIIMCVCVWNFQANLLVDPGKIMRDKQNCYGYSYQTQLQPTTVHAQTKKQQNPSFSGESSLRSLETYDSNSK